MTKFPYLITLYRCLVLKETFTIFRVTFAQSTGGALSMKASTYQQLNGFSNRFWGWGNEDDDMYSRLVEYIKLLFQQIYLATNISSIYKKYIIVYISVHYLT